MPSDWPVYWMGGGGLRQLRELGVMLVSRHLIDQFTGELDSLESLEQC